MNPDIVTPPPKTKVIVAADLGLLRAYRVVQAPTDRQPHLELLDELRPEIAHQKVSAQLSDQAGRFAKGSGARGVPGDLSSGEQHDLSLEKQRRLIKLLAGSINTLLAKTGVVCSLAASAPIHRRLLDELAEPVRAKITTTLARNLTKSAPAALLAHFTRRTRRTGGPVRHIARPEFNPFSAMNPSPTHRDKDDDRNPSLQLELLLAYEDRPTAERAKRAVEAVLSKSEVNAQPQLHLWRLDVLSDPQISARAAQEASTADILVVAMHGRHRLASQAEARLKQWINLKRTKPRALVISLDAEAKPHAAANATLTELRSAADRNGVCVMLHFGELTRPKSEVGRADVRSRSPFISHYDAFHQSPNPHPQWGINE
jgi:hypothetical protein